MSEGIDPVVFALTGERLPIDPVGSAVARLVGAGWTSQRVARFRDEQFAAGLPWPLPVPRELVPDGFAAFSAALADARSRLGLDVRSVPPAPGRAPTADERRLLAERPPHW